MRRGWRERLDLEPNLEGGYYRQTYESEATVETPDGRRPLLNSIFYLLTAESPLGHLHRNRSAITHFHHHGGPATYVLVSPDAEVRHIVLGPDLSAGHLVSFTVPGWWWKASYIDEGSDECLISEAVTPGFRYDDHEMATVESIAVEHPGLVDSLRPYILVPR